MGKRTVTWEGAEASEETGEGVVESVTAPRGDRTARNVQVAIRADHLNQPVTGWLDTQDEQVGWTLDDLEAHRGQRVSYRVVVHRRRGVDKAVPFDQLDRNDKVRDLVSLAPEGHELAGRAEIAQDGRSDAGAPGHTGQGGNGAPAPAAEAAAGRHARPTTPAERAAARGRGQQPAPATTAPPAPPTLAEQYDQQPPDRQAPTPPSEHTPPPNRGAVAEARPWEGSNTDGSVNIGSYAVQAGTWAVNHAAELLGGTDDVERLRGVARWVLSMADAVQAAHRGKVDRLDGSHTRARAMVSTVIEQAPPDLTADRDELAAYKGRTVERAGELLSIAVEIGTA